MTKRKNETETAFVARRRAYAVSLQGKAAQAAYDATPQGRTIRLARFAKYNAKRNATPDGILKRHVRSVVQAALRSGRLVKEHCRVCSAKKTEAHHEDYTQPLKVVWYCRKHHRQYHLKLKRACSLTGQARALQA